MEELRAKYQDRGVEFVVVYVREPHPREPAFRQYQQPRTLKERRRHAQELAQTRKMAATLVVDTMEDEVSRQFGSLPNMVYILDRQGTVVYKATWTMAEKVDRVLEELTREVVPSAHLSDHA